MTAKEKAKDIVNKIYQPLGHLSCNTSSNNMWGYSKGRAIEFVDEMLWAFDANTIPHIIDFYKSVKEEIEKL